MAPLRYRVRGSPAGKPLLMLHGFLGSRDDWRQVIAELEPAIRCITVDLPGHGKNRSHSEFSFAETAAALVEILDELGIPRAGLLGYSMGGRIALYTASRYPQRFFLIMESAAFLDRTPERLRHDAKLAAQLRNVPLIEFLKSWYDQPLFRSLKNHPEFDALLTKRLDNDPDALANSLLYLGVGVQPLLPELERQHSPLLMLVGELDEKYRRLAQQVQPPDSVIIVPGCGHNIHFENPTLFGQLVKEFINKTI